MNILAFDAGEDIIGILELSTGGYVPYRGTHMIQGARRLIGCTGIIISFNGTNYDLRRLAEIVGAPSPDMLQLQGTHLDMLREASIDRWPPDPGTAPIIGTDLRSQYEHYFGPETPESPISVNDDYEWSNWRDCFMAGQLWKRICAD